MSTVLAAVPMSITEACEFVLNHHRHCKAPQGAKFAIGATDGLRLVGVAIAGRPVARHLDDGDTLEILRVCVLPDATKGTNSFLYSRVWRIWQLMGGRRCVTYTLESESGSSLRGAGWTVVGQSRAHNGWRRSGRERDWQPVYGQQKLRWERNAP